jgi:hypothetical protein
MTGFPAPAALFSAPVAPGAPRLIAAPALNAASSGSPLGSRNR